MRSALLLPFAALALAQTPRVHEIRPGEDPQRAADSAAAGDRLVFLPGLHQHPLRKHRSLLFVDKPLDIELQPGATLKVAPGQGVLEKEAEITTDHGAVKTIDDLEAGGEYDLGLGGVMYSIRIDGAGKDGAPDTFTWGSGAVNQFQHAGVPITGDWQPLSHGVKIRFRNRSGHSLGSLWFLSYDGRESYGIRVGHGTQKDFISGVRIFGKGTIDLNASNNEQPSGFVKNISACILVHGRVRDVSIEGVTMRDTMRSVMLYGEHTGQFLQGGGTGPGESFDAENISIVHTRTINPNGSGYLLGHPSHRGRLSKVRCNYNYMETATTSIEPNFNLDQYEVIGNVIKSGGRAIHCWRRSTNGLISDNVRVDDTTGLEVVMVNAPGAWQAPENVILRDNRNHQSEPVGYWANVAGGWKNSARGAYSGVTGGNGSVAAGAYSRAHGMQTVARRAGEDAISAGAFAAPGDAQSGVVVGRAETRGAEAAELRLTGGEAVAVPRNATSAFRALIAGRSEGGREQASFEATGTAVWEGGTLTIRGAAVRSLAATSPALGVEAAGGDRLRLLVRGIAGTPMRWVARLELVDIEY